MESAKIPVRLDFKSEVYWQGKGVEITMPNPPLIPREEGLHFIVNSKDKTGSWRDINPKDVLRQAFFALPVARIVSESYASPDYWANIQLKSLEGFANGINVIGRNPRSEAGWGKPPRAADVKTQTPIDEGEIKKLIAGYISLWDEKRVQLFSQGVNAVGVESEEFREALGTRSNDVLWMNDKFTLDVIRRPHLSGFHVVVSQRSHGEDELIKRPWQVSEDPSQIPSQRQDFLEEMAILLAVQRVLWQEGVPFYNPEIQFNSNWAESMQPEDKGGTLNPALINEKSEKRAHRQHKGKDWTTKTHGHLYATDSPDKYVSLPSRPESEVPDEWQGISPTKPEDIVRIREILQAKLTQFIEQNCEGTL